MFYELKRRKELVVVLWSKDPIYIELILFIIRRDSDDVIIIFFGINSLGCS